MAGLNCTPILPHLEGPKGEGLIARFLAKVDKRGPDECWDWADPPNVWGYGSLRLKRARAVQAHRFALVLHLRSERTDLMVLHSCNRPCCCNPRHLRFGTARDNWDDRRASLTTRGDVSHG